MAGHSPKSRDYHRPAAAHDRVGVDTASGAGGGDGYGAVYVAPQATLTLEGTTFEDNQGCDVSGSGDVVAEGSFTPGGELPELPRFGMQMAVPASLATLT